MPYYGVRMRYNKEVLIKAKDENEAEETARHADLNMVKAFTKRKGKVTE